MNLGVLTSINKDVKENIRKVAEMGFSHCQLKCWNSAFLTPDYAEAVKSACEEYGVTVTAFWCGWDGGFSYWNFYEGPLSLGLIPREYRAERTRMLLKGSDFAKLIGVTDVVTHVGFLPENPLSTEYDEICTLLRFICTKLKAKEQYFLFETGQETPITLLRTIETIGTGNCGINLDPANLLLYGKANPVDAVGIFGKYVRGVHAKDGKYPTDGRHLGKEYPIGEGLVNFPRLIPALKEAGFDGSLTIEREISGDQQIKDIAAAKEYLEKLI